MVVQKLEVVCRKRKIRKWEDYGNYFSCRRIRWWLKLIGHSVNVNVNEAIIGVQICQKYAEWSPVPVFLRPGW